MSHVISIDLESAHELATRMVPLFKYTSFLMPETSEHYYKLGERLDVSLTLHDRPCPFYFSTQVTWLFENRQLPCVLTLLPKDLATGHRLNYLTHKHKSEYGKLFRSLLNSCAT